MQVYLFRSYKNWQELGVYTYVIAEWSGTVIGSNHKNLVSLNINDNILAFFSHNTESKGTLTYDLE